MTGPSRRTSRLALAGGLVGALAVAALGFTVGRSTAPQPVSPPPAPAPADTPVAPPEPPPVAPSVLDRAELIALARVAADTFARGAGDTAADQPSSGRRFTLRLPFGCSGPGEPARAAMGWRFDPAAGALRLWVRPVAWPAASWNIAGATPAVESIAGFWIERPWTDSEDCAAAAADAGAAGGGDAPSSSQTLGLAEFDRAGGSRIGRQSDEPLTAVVRVDGAALETGRGFRLRLTGRLADAPGGGPVICRASGPLERPTCLVAVSLDEAAIENGATGDTLATWSLSQDPPGRDAGDSAAGIRPRAGS